ncbi:NAD(P)/FAD-dependent oxidoreductase [Sphingomonas oligophenolica]|uniref:FAD-binding monooxygenase n=1 Tax=Sphingomonas oligophenolica TaxID=301154 RepID=A0A502CTZ5_9SPHN|nr:FAD-dependent monooxygenase [Sphingomonas oligophenolica]TPG15589.1 FAD-binding monooxygenase [Sphingomonas oligophenolica]
MRRTSALIVGGGPAGAATAIELARARLPHLLLERERGGDALCGGFISWRTIQSLESLGVDPDTLNPARLTHVRLFAKDRRRDAALPHPALAVSRRRLDTVMLDTAIRMGAAVEDGVTIREIEGLVARAADGATIETEALFLASGKHDIRGLARPADARGEDPTLGLRVRLPPSRRVAAVADSIELHLFDRGYAGLALQEDGSANLCLAVHRSRLQEAGTPRALIDAIAHDAPVLAERLADFDAGLPIDAIANVPYGWRARTGVPGLFRLGDQAGVIPSLAGEGMGIAIASGISAARAYRDHGAAGAAAWQLRFARQLARPITVAGIVRRVVEHPRAALLMPLLRPTMITLVANATRVGYNRS